MARKPRPSPEQEAIANAERSLVAACLLRADHIVAAAQETKAHPSDRSARLVAQAMADGAEFVQRARQRLAAAQQALGSEEKA